jgi:uncharacterized protein (DUF849 family)
VLQACLNGTRAPGDHPALPVTPEELAADAARVAGLGVFGVHIHPRAADGSETLRPQEVGETVSAVRAATSVEIGVTTGSWVVPEPADRLLQVAGWAALGEGRPDLASVNVHEEGWQEVCVALHDGGIAIELGVFHAAAAGQLAAAGIPPGAVRVLAEIQPTEPADALAEVEVLLHLLTGCGVPVLLHGAEETTWAVLAEARAGGLATRIGLEDTLALPDGRVPEDNAALVEAATGYPLNRVGTR